MDATTLRKTVHDFFPKTLIKATIKRLGVQGIGGISRIFEV